MKREFEQYGAIKSIRMVMSTKDSKPRSVSCPSQIESLLLLMLLPRGYAFIEFEHEKDMHCEYWIQILCNAKTNLMS